MIACNRTRGSSLASNVVKADTVWARARGLLGRRSLGSGEAMWIEPCAMIHTFFMAFEIDAVFVDGNLRALRVFESLKPWRISPWVPDARSVLELAGGSLKGTVSRGDQLEIK